MFGFQTLRASARSFTRWVTILPSTYRRDVEAAEAVIKNEWWPRLGIPELAIPSILDAWERDDFSLYGRFDLSFDGCTPPKLLEYNADTPKALLEASVAQWFWLQDLHPSPSLRVISSVLRS